MSDSNSLAQGILGLLAKPLPLLVAGAAATAGTLAFLGVKPESIAAGIIVLAIAILLFLGGIYFMKRKQRTQVDSAIAGMTDSISTQDNTPQARARVATLRSKWERLFREVRPEYVRNKPILMILGESKSGKSVLLDRSGLELESDNRQARDWEEGTENVDPWFFPEGLVFDTAGEMVDSSEVSTRIDWPELIKLTKRLRPRNPVNGVILAVPVWRLQSSDENARIEKASKFQLEFQRLVHGLGVRFPVSVVVTMSDLIDGYSAFARRQNASQPGDLYTMFGWSRYRLMDEFGAPEAMSEAVEAVTARIEAQVLHDTCNPDVAAVERREAFEIWCFPRNLAKVGHRLAEYLRIVFKEKQSTRVANAPFFRGIFFGSAMQTIRRGEPRRKEPEQPKSDPFHIRDLLSIRLFGEVGLVTTAPKAEAAARMRRFVGIVVPASVGVVSAAVAVIAFSLASYVSANVKNLQDLALALERADSERRIAVLEETGDPQPAEELRQPWIADRTTAPERMQALHAALEAARGTGGDGSDLHWYLRWYGPFEKSVASRREEAVRRAWHELVADPLLRFVASKEGIGAADSRYGLLALEETGEGVAPKPSAQAAELDRALYAGLQALIDGKAAPVAAASNAPDAEGQKAGERPKPVVLAKAGEKWDQPSVPKPLPARGSGVDSDAAAAGSAPSLAPLVAAAQVATAEQVPTDAAQLLDWPAGWLPDASLAEMAGKAQETRQSTLRTKLAAAAQPLVVAAKASADWSQQKADDAPLAPDAWESFSTGVLDKIPAFGQRPSERLDALAGSIGWGDQKAVFVQRIVPGEWWRGPWNTADAVALVAAVESLDPLAQLPMLAEAGRTIQKKTAEIGSSAYQTGAMGNLAIELPEATRDGKKDDALTAQLRSELARLVNDHYLAAAAWAGSKVKPAPSTLPAAKPMGGVLAPIFDLSEPCAAAVARRSALAKDLAAVEAFLAAADAQKIASVGQVRTGAGAAKAAIDQSVADLAKAVSALPTDSLVGEEPAIAEQQGPDLVSEVFEQPNPASVVKAVADALRAQAAQREKTLGGNMDGNAGNAGGASAASKQTPAEEDIAAAIAAIDGAMKSAAQQSEFKGTPRRDLAAILIARGATMAPEPSGQDGAPAPSISTRVESALRAVDAPAGPEGLMEAERRYWRIFWRDLITLSSAYRDRQKKEFTDFGSLAVKKFPLKHDVAAPNDLAPAEVAAFVLGRAPESGGASVPDVAAELKALRDKTGATSSLTKLSGETALEGRQGPDRKALPSKLAGMLAPPADMRKPELQVSINFTGDSTNVPVPEGVEAVSNDADSQVRDDKDVYAVIRQGGVESEMRRNADIQFQFDRKKGAVELEVGMPSAERQALKLGADWCALRLAQRLGSVGTKDGRPWSPSKSEPLFVDEDGFAWGALDIGDGVVVFVAFRMQWVDAESEQSGVETRRINVNAWLDAVRAAKAG